MVFGSILTKVLSLGVAACPQICLNLLLRQVHVCGNVLPAAVTAIIFNGCHTQVAPNEGDVIKTQS